MSQQALREAFSESELHTAKQKHQQVQEHVQVRWTSYRSSTGGHWELPSTTTVLLVGHLVLGTRTC